MIIKFVAINFTNFFCCCVFKTKKKIKLICTNKNKKTTSHQLQKEHP